MYIPQSTLSSPKALSTTTQPLDRALLFLTSASVVGLNKGVYTYIFFMDSQSRPVGVPGGFLPGLMTNLKGLSWKNHRFNAL